MTAGSKRPLETGPFEQLEWPEQLVARVTTAGAAPRIHGYDVEADLARHYGFAEVILLALTGEVPEAGIGRAFSVALTFLAPAPISQAPTHAASIARIYGARPSGILATGAIALTEQARTIAEEHAELLSALNRGDSAVPDRYRSADEADRSAVARLQAALADTDVEVTALASSPTRMAGLLALLHRCGLTRTDQIQAVMVLSRLASLAAEAFAAPPLGMREYPMNLPPYRYVEDVGDE